MGAQLTHTKPEKFEFFHVFITDFTDFLMLNARSTNQRALSRSRRNRRDRQQPETPPANQRKSRIIFSPNLKYQNSFHNDNGVLFLSKRKRDPPTAEEIETRK